MDKDTPCKKFAIPERHRVLTKKYSKMKRAHETWYSFMERLYHLSCAWCRPAAESMKLCPEWRPPNLGVAHPDINYNI